MNIIFTCFVILGSLTNQLHTESIASSFDERKMNFTEFGVKYEHTVEEHEVTTEDGYVLMLFRIPGKRKKPVLLMHGLTDSADTFVLRGNQSIAISLANEGYDVWAGNIRGNKYSRRHLELNPDKNMKFWDYSFHEAGYYDLPAMIDYILQNTGEKKLQTIGHSQGTTMHFVLLSQRPEYNDKIKIFIALAPSAFLGDVRQPWITITQLAPVINEVLISNGIEEAFSKESSFTTFLKSLCSQDPVGSEVCFSTVFSTLLGDDSKRIEPSFLKIAIEHVPTGTSRKTLLHYSQLIQTKRFSEFDYGVDNVRYYNSSLPPDYNLAAVRTKVAIFIGRNDPLSRIRDVAILKSSLPNVVYYHVMKPKQWNHIDFVWANDMAYSLLPFIFEMLKKHD